MPNIIEITDLSAPELDIYARLTQAQLRSRLEPEKGIFIAESPKVIARALDAGYTPLSLLMERRQITGPAAEILTRCGDAPVYTADRDTLASLTGFELTRGVLCAFRRPLPRSVEEVCRNARRVAVLEGIGLHQCGGHLPQCCRAEYGRCAHHPLLLRPPVPPGSAREHGHRVSGAMGTNRCVPCRLAGERHRTAARSGLPDCRHGPERPFREHR